MVGEEKTAVSKELTQGQMASDLLDCTVLDQEWKTIIRRIQTVYDIGIDGESFH
jgi:hypothetical protein